MDILTCCLLSKKEKKSSYSFAIWMWYANHKQLWMNGKRSRIRKQMKKNFPFYFYSMHITPLWQVYTELADMSFIFVFNTVEEAFTDDWIFRYFLSLDFLSFLLDCPWHILANSENVAHYKMYKRRSISLWLFGYYEKLNSIYLNYNSISLQHSCL